MAMRPFPPLELIPSAPTSEDEHVPPWPGRALLKSYSSTVEEAQTSKPGWPHAPLSFRPDSNFIFLYHPAVKKWTLFQDLPATNFIFLHLPAVMKLVANLRGARVPPSDSPAPDVVITREAKGAVYAVVGGR